MITICRPVILDKTKDAYRMQKEINEEKINFAYSDREKERIRDRIN